MNTLVIKNADFSSTRVAKVTIREIKCEDFSFNSQEVTVNGRESVTLGYTITPLNTNERILWDSSDKSVATVKNGVLTILGIGETEISVRCGSVRASCVVTCDIYENPYAIIGYVLQRTIDGVPVHRISNGSNYFAGCAELGHSNSISTSIVIEDNDRTKFIPNTELAAISIPNNATQIHAVAENTVRGYSSQWFFVDDDYHSVSGGTFQADESTGVVDVKINIPEGATGFIFNIESTNSLDETVYGRNVTQSTIQTAFNSRYPNLLHYI